MLDYTVGGILEKYVAENPDHEFMIYPDRGLRFTYKEFTSQYSIHPKSDGKTFDYKIMDINPPTYIFVKSIPLEVEEGSTLYIGLQQNVTDAISASSFPTFSIEKIDGNKIWLYNAANRYGIIVEKE